MRRFTFEKNDTFFIVLIGLVVLVGVYQYNRNSDFAENLKYTIGNTRKTYMTASGDKLVNYTFKYNEENYGGAEDYKKSILVPSGKYIVGFSSNDPMNCKMYFEYTIPDSFDYSNVPTQGWDSIPEFIIKYNETPNR